MPGYRKLLAVIACSLIAACTYTDLDDSTADSGVAGPDGGGEQDCGQRSEVENPCLVSGVIADIDVRKVDKVDLLFVVDNSDSMKEPQEKLRQEMPRMIRILTSGDLNPDDNGGIPEPGKDFPAARDLHLAVVSTDMGLPGVKMSIDPEGRCTIGLGDDGRFQSVGNPAGDPNLSCQYNYPPFISFAEGQDANAAAQQLECIAALGMYGCGFEMPLEAALKALWPASPGNLDDYQQGLGLLFFGNSPPHGDQEHIEFLRGTLYHPAQSDRLSVLAVIMVTDEDDCSAGARGDLDFLEHPNTAPPGIAEQPPNLRCYYDTVNNQGNKFPVERYINGLKALRPDYDQLVVFGAIAGVPPGIYEVDYDADGDGLISQQERDAYYQAILVHPLMQERIRDDGQNLEPSCTLAANPNVPNFFVTTAYPARRITGVAAGFGENGVIQSICQESFTGAMDSIIQAITRQLGGVCLPRKLRRNSDGIVECDVVWGMPGGRGCDLPFLSPPPADRPQQRNGRNLCVVDQVPVMNPTATDPEQALAPGHQGWYYDDFSADRLKECRGDPDNLQRIAFTLVTTASGQVIAEPPAGATVELQCLNEIYGALGAKDPGVATLGRECNVDMDCGPAGFGMRCHIKARTCVISCSSNADCPAAWFCDVNKDTAFAQSAGFAICVNPICDSPEGEARNCGNSDVGEACLPRLVPEGGFDENRVYLETNSPDCETRVCGVFKFAGDPQISDPRVLEDRIYCTCRCQAPDESISTCKCPADFECVQAMDIGGPGIRGGYCVRTGQW
jgi:hypothetical protein